MSTYTLEGVGWVWVTSWVGVRERRAPDPGPGPGGAWPMDEQVGVKNPSFSSLGDLGQRWGPAEMG